MYHSEFDVEKKYGWDLDANVGPTVPRYVSRKYRKDWSRAGTALRKSRVSDYAIYMIDNEKEAAKVKGTIDYDYFERDAAELPTPLKDHDEMPRRTGQLATKNDFTTSIGGLVGQNDAFVRYVNRFECQLQRVLGELEDIKRTQAKTQNTLERVQNQLGKLQAVGGVDGVGGDVKRVEHTFQHAIDFDDMYRSQARTQALLDHVEVQLGKI